MTTADVAPTGLVTDDMLEQYHSEGYFIIENALTPDQLELLRSGAQFAIDKVDAEMDAAGTDRLRLNARASATSPT